MATTPNYGFIMPDPTDFVTALPADFEIFGDEVDLRVKALNPETTEGDLAYRGATADAKDRLAIGTAGQVLAVNAGEDAPEWITPAAGGGMTLISDVAIGVGITTVSFTSISASFKHLLITWEDLIRASGSGTFFFKINNAGADHLWANYKVNGTTLTANTSNTSSGPAWPLPNASTPGNNGALWIFDYSDTTFRKPFEAFAYGYNSATPNLEGNKTVGQFDSDNAIDRVDIIANAAFFSNRGTVKLYGVN